MGGNPPPKSTPPADRGRIEGRSRPGRRPQHGLFPLRRAVRALTTDRIDGRSLVGVAVRKWKADIRHDLGGDLTRAQETILEIAAQSWVILTSIDNWIARQPSLVTKKRALLPVVMHRTQIAEGLARRSRTARPRSQGEGRWDARRLLGAEAEEGGCGRPRRPRSR